MLIKNMDSLEHELYERAFRHMVEHERKMLGEGEKRNPLPCNTKSKRQGGDGK